MHPGRQRSVGPVGTGVLTGATLVAAAASSPRYASDLEQARPQTSGEEELQLQLALAMSREEAEKPVPPASHRDEDLQLQLALSLSRQEHEKVVQGQTRPGHRCLPRFGDGEGIGGGSWGTNQLLCCTNLGASHLLSADPNPVLMPYLSLLQGVRSWKEDDSPVANGAEPAGHRRRDREPGREERKEEEKLKTSQVDNGLRSAAPPGLDVAELASVH
ncbi:hypothetical protein U0070_027438 [Myodes glareolus]|uniref:Uncharacterized protein n=1 Tax=Myodes glareolus TaxID=447135 RepID=A0AAW0J9Z5_MYOGA